MPSKKLLPFINTSMQKIVNIIDIKFMFNNLFKKSTLMSFILKSINKTKLNNKIIWRKSLILGDEILLLSENIPNIKKDKPKKFNKIDSLKNNKEQMNTIKPPHKGGDFKDEFINFLCFEKNVLSISIWFFLNIYKIPTDVIMLKKKITKKLFSMIINIFF